MASSAPQFRDFTPLVERISIDEASLDVAGSERLFGSPVDIAVAIRPAGPGRHRPTRVRRRGPHEAPGQDRSQVAKPDRLILVELGAESNFLHPLPVQQMWGVGPVTPGAPHRQGHPHDR